MNKFKKNFYQGRDPRDMPAYGVVEAARYLRVPYFVLYSWLRPAVVASNHGSEPKPLIVRPQGSSQLSFWNLVEGHVLKALLRSHNIPVAEIRQAISYAEQDCGISRLLISEFEVGARQIFIKRIGQLISLGRGGQLAMEKVLDRYIERITYRNNQAVSLDPFVYDGDSRFVKISPDFAFGKPVIASAGVSTYVIAERFELGEDKKDIADDYGIKEAEVEEAIIYEQAAA
ncbi:MAG: DUF433 domain-containing protein [Porticoccaceae bacterium]